MYQKSFLGLWKYSYLPNKDELLVWYSAVQYLVPRNMVWVGSFIWQTEFQCPLPSLIPEFRWCVIPCNIFYHLQEVQTVNCTLPFFTSELLPFQPSGNLFPPNFPVQAERTMPIPPTLKLSSLCSADSIDSSRKNLSYLHPICFWVDYHVRNYIFLQNASKNE